jgi:dihydrofolate reductase
VFGDARFEMPDLTDWNELDRQDFDASETNPYPYSFVTYDRHR